MAGTRSKCGRGLAPDGSGSVTDELADTPPSGASPLPQFDLHVSVEGWFALALALAFDLLLILILGGPPNHCRITGTPSLSEVPSVGARAFCLLLRSIKSEPP